MFLTYLKRLVLASAILGSAAVFGQNAADVPSAAIAPASAGDLNLTPSALLARIEAQQRQIDDLKALVTKLENRLQGPPEPIASTRPMIPVARVTNFEGGGAPEPAPAPAPTPTVASAESYRNPRELLPDIGHIGAEIGLLVGGSTNPYKDNSGFATGGFIDLPWKNFRGGKLSYEIMIGLQQSTTTQTTTSGVNVLANAAVNAYLGNTAANSTNLAAFLAGPLPITSTVQENSKVLTVAPVLLKYAFTSLGRFRPYIVGGLGTYVWIGSDNNSQSFNANAALGSLANAPVGNSTLGATLNAILQGSQIGGLAPTAPELAARGVPHGQGNIQFGGQFGGGFEFRFTPKLSMGIDVRRNQVEGANASFTSFSFKQGLHW